MRVAPSQQSKCIRVSQAEEAALTYRVAQEYGLCHPDVGNFLDSELSVKRRGKGVGIGNGD